MKSDYLNGKSLSKSPTANYDNPDLKTIIVENKALKQKIKNAVVEWGRSVILDSISEEIIFLGTDMRIIWANKVASKTIGLSVKKLKGCLCHKVWHKQDECCEGCPVKRTIETEAACEGEIVDPRNRWWFIRAYPVKNENGKIVGVVKIANNITEKRKSEENLRFLSAISKQVSDSIIVTDKDFKITFVNDAAKRLYGYNEKELLGKSPDILNAEPMARSIQKEIYRTVSSGGVWRGEHLNKKKDGSNFICEFEIGPLKYRKEDVNSYIAIIRDVTLRTKAEKSIREGRDTLEKREKYFRSMIENVSDVIKVLDKNGYFRYVSSSSERVLGYKPEELIGKKAFDHIHKGDVLRIMKTFMQGLKTPGITLTLEYRYRHKNGTWIIMESKGTNLIDDPAVNAIIVNSRDITERKVFEEKLEGLNRNLLQSNKRLKHLALRDSHTGLFNHRYLEEIIDAEFYRAKSHAEPLSVVMIDIDYFKSVNDAYGHQFGDLILKQFARYLRRIVRKYDVVVRFGGEEFIIISPATDHTTAVSMAGRILESINLNSFGNRHHNIKLKVSIGVSSYPEDIVLRGIDLINIVDKILNKAKEDGGNRVYSASNLTQNNQNPAGDMNYVKEASVDNLKVKIDKLTTRSNQSIAEAIFAFAKTIELKDHYTGEHVENTVHYATEIARALNMDADDVERIRQASMLHDLGKIGISEKILLKRSKLTEKEFDEIKKHPQIAVDILRPIQFLHDLIPFIYYHHERWDGRGYPAGLKKEEIPLGARIIAIADVYQALISDRPYRKAYPKREVMHIIRKEKGAQFDPKIVDVFVNILGKQ